jgi:hypothetical protein
MRNRTDIYSIRPRTYGEVIDEFNSLYKQGEKVINNGYEIINGILTEVEQEVTLSSCAYISMYDVVVVTVEEFKEPINIECIFKLDKENEINR